MTFCGFIYRARVPETAAKFFPHGNAMDVGRIA
jgi:hypothetical protein